MKFSAEKIERAFYSDNIIRTAYVLFFSGIAFTVAFLMPSFREAVIGFVRDFIVRRPLNHRWPHRLFSAGFLGLFMSSIVTAYLISIANEKLKKIQIVFPVMLILCTLAFISVYTYTYGNYWINSDSSAELLGGKTLSGESSLFSSKWYYGTEFWFIYRQPISILLFKLTDDWPLVRAWNLFFQLLILIPAYFFMMKQTKLETKYILLSSCFLIVPLSYPYWQDVLFEAYYNLFFVKVFLLTGCFLASLQENAAKKRVYALFFVLLGFLTGTEGIRILYNYFLPLILNVMALSYFGYIENKRKTITLTVLGCMAGLAGYFVNIAILKNLFSFAYFGSIYFDVWDGGFFSKLSRIVFGVYLSFFGYKSYPIMHIAGVLSGIGFLFFITIIVFLIRITKAAYKKTKPLSGELQQNPSETFFLFYFIISTIFHLVFFQLVSIAVANRYFFAALIFLFPVVSIFLTYFSKRLNPLYGTLLFIVLAGFLFGNGFCIFYKSSKPEADSNAPRRGYIDFLLENSLHYGFASYWNANVTTELSNGKIDMISLSVSNSDAGLEFRLYKWLTPAKFDDPYYYTGEAFFLLTRQEWEAQKNIAAHSYRPPAYIDESYVVIIYQQATDIYMEVIHESPEQAP